MKGQLLYMRLIYTAIVMMWVLHNKKGPHDEVRAFKVLLRWLYRSDLT